MTIVLNGTTGITTPGTDSTTLVVNSNNISAVNSFGFRNRIINGAMMIDQRNAGAATAGSGSSPYTLDRWKVYSAGANNPVQQVAGPAGYQYAMQISGIASNTACVPYQRIEAANIADLASITATASFLIYNSGASFSASVVFKNPTTTADDFSALTSIASNSITVPNGWTTITTSVSLTSGVARGLQFEIDLGAAMTAGRTVQITGVQLEAGSVASPFERRDYGRELIMCERYYQRISGFVCGTGTNTTQCGASIMYKTEMRTSPSAGLSAALQVTRFAFSDFTQSSANIGIAGAGARVNSLGVSVDFGNFTGLPSDTALPAIVTGGILTLSAEL